MSPVEPPADGIRLQKVLASAGVGSRRASEALIGAGRVRVNGRVAVLGARVDPDRDVVAVDGRQIATAADLVHVAVNKPRGMVSTMRDERGRPCVGDLVGDLGAIHHVGRLDADSEGLLLLTNDGPLSFRLTHPSHGVVKRYLVEVRGLLARADTRRLRTGLQLDDGPVRVDAVSVVDASRERSIVEVAIHEGRKHIVRRAFDQLEHPVTRLVRVAVGPIHLGDLRPGRFRHLQPAEVRSLYRCVDLTTEHEGD